MNVSKKQKKFACSAATLFVAYLIAILYTYFLGESGFWGHMFLAFVGFTLAAIHNELCKRMS